MNNSEFEGTGERPSQNTLRARVLDFAFSSMLKKLLENTHKGDWLECNMIYLLNRLNEEVRELREEAALKVSDADRVADEAGDVANFAMMIAQVAKNFGTGAIENERREAESKEYEGKVSVLLSGNLLSFVSDYPQKEESLDNSPLWWLTKQLEEHDDGTRYRVRITAEFEEVNDDDAD